MYGHMNVKFVFFIFAATKSLNKIRLLSSFVVYLGTPFAYKNTEGKTFSGDEEGHVWWGVGDCWLLGTLTL